MTSKESLKLLYSDAENYAYFNETEEDLSEIKAEYELIKQDLDKLEKFAHENASLHTEIDSLQSENKKLNKQLDVFFDKLDKNTIRALDLISYDLYDENSKLKKVIEILKGKICVHQGYICYDAYADIKLTKEEYELLKGVLEDD